jgi:hypothetical protein
METGEQRLDADKDLLGSDQDIERLKRGGCYEREKKRVQGKQEGATEKP